MGQAQELAKKFWDLLENNRLGELDALMHADAHFKMPGVEMRGPAALRPVLAAYIAAFPDMRHHVKHSVEAGDTAAFELEVVGTHTGPMQTPNGTVPPTKARVVWESCDYVRVKDGKIIQWHGYFDNVPFLQALGLMPKP